MECARNKTKKVRVGCTMKKAQTLIPKPGSRFQRVQCKECGEESVVYSHVSTTVACKACGNTLAEPTGSVAEINGKVLGSAE